MIDVLNDPAAAQAFLTGAFLIGWALGFVGMALTLVYRR